jgi:hypothetical protein
MIYVAIVAVVAALSAGLYFLYRGAESKAALRQTQESLKVEESRVAQMESAAAKAREERLQELDEEAAAVRDADDAARFLRAQFNWGRKPEGD